jgi:hypothetical protein
MSIIVGRICPLTTIGGQNLNAICDAFLTIL